MVKFKCFFCGSGVVYSLFGWNIGGLCLFCFAGGWSFFSVSKTRSYLFLQFFNLDIILYMRKAGIKILELKHIHINYLVPQKCFLSVTYVGHIHIMRIRDVTSHFICCFHSNIVYGPERGVLSIEVAWIGACSSVVWTFINLFFSEMKESPWLDYVITETVTPGWLLVVQHYLGLDQVFHAWQCKKIGKLFSD